MNYSKKGVWRHWIVSYYEVNLKQRLYWLIKSSFLCHFLDCVYMRWVYVSKSQPEHPPWGLCRLLYPFININMIIVVYLIFSPYVNIIYKRKYMTFMHSNKEKHDNWLFMPNCQDQLFHAGDNSHQQILTQT